MDEDEGSLYFTNKLSSDSYVTPQVQTHTIYVHDNIIYKFTNLSEYCYQFSEVFNV
jgi:hypothetical protein